MSQTNIPTDLVQKIQTSPLLTDAEKKHWINNLPTMKQQQVEHLDHILTTAANLQWNRNMENYMAMVTRQTHTTTIPAAAAA